MKLSGNRYFNLVDSDNTILFPSGCPKFNELDGEEVKRRITSKMLRIKKLMDQAILPYIDIPLRRRENIVYDDKGKLFLGNQTFRIEMDDKYDEFGKTIKMAKLIHEVLLRDIHTTKRDLFYQDVNLFENQNISDKLINNVATWLGCSRGSLNVTASSKGVVIGNVSFTERGDFIDCRKIGSGKSITPNIQHIENLQSDAEFVLVVEKDSIFSRLAEDQFYKIIPSIIITAKGQPDLATRAFIKKLVGELKIPVFGLMDADIYGLLILSTYARGSVQMAYETPRLCHNSTYWLGLRPSQFTEYGISKNIQLNLNENDKYEIREMMELPNFKLNEKIIEEMELMLQMGTKAELQALNAHDPHFITNVFLPQALEAGDFIKF